MSGKKRAVLQWCIVILLFAGILLLLWRSGLFGVFSSEEELQAYIARCGPWSRVVFFGIQLVSVVLPPVPNNVVAVVGGVLFGTFQSFLMSWVAVSLGSVGVFLLARMLGRDFARHLAGKKMSEKYLDLIRRKRDTFLLLAFLLPFFPDDMICMLAGLSDIRFRRFLLLCLTARPWGLLVAAALGGSALVIPLWGLVLIGVVGVAFFVVAMKYGDRVEEKLIEKINRIKK